MYQDENCSFSRNFVSKRFLIFHTYSHYTFTRLLHTSPVNNHEKIRNKTLHNFWKKKLVFVAALFWPHPVQASHLLTNR